MYSLQTLKIRSKTSPNWLFVEKNKQILSNIKKLELNLKNLHNQYFDYDYLNKLEVLKFNIVKGTNEFFKGQRLNHKLIELNLKIYDIDEFNKLINYKVFYKVEKLIIKDTFKYRNREEFINQNQNIKLLGSLM